MRIVLVGGGKIGKKLAEMLSKEKNDVILIEKDEKRAEELAEELEALVLHGDATEKKMLKDADMEKCEALVTVTGDDKTNLMVCQIAKSLNVPKVIARINDSSNEEFFEKQGVTSLVNTTTSAIMSFKTALAKDGRQVIGMLGGNQGEIIEAYVNPGSKIIGRSVESLANDKMSVAAMIRKGKLALPKPKAKVREKDSVIVCIPAGSRKRLERLLKD
ncbi:MAG: NAD-binding protein [Candidatus Aenigmarchaeota archaeon]|nr:NAD-binding protein [Candidatus Aenigmarchaeota archaeon]